MDEIAFRSEAREAAYKGIDVLLLLADRLQKQLDKDKVLVTEGAVDKTIDGEGAARDYYQLRKAVYVLGGIAEHGFK